MTSTLTTTTETQTSTLSETATFTAAVQVTGQMGLVLHSNPCGFAASSSAQTAVCTAIAVAAGVPGSTVTCAVSAASQVTCPGSSGTPRRLQSQQQSNVNVNYAITLPSSNLALGQAASANLQAQTTNSMGSILSSQLGNAGLSYTFSVTSISTPTVGLVSTGGVTATTSQVTTTTTTGVNVGLIVICVAASIVVVLIMTSVHLLVCFCQRRQKPRAEAQTEAV